ARGSLAERSGAHSGASAGTGFLILTAAGGIATLALLTLGVWWLIARRSEERSAAAGSTAALNADAPASVSPAQPSAAAVASTASTATPGGAGEPGEATSASATMDGAAPTDALVKFECEPTCDAVKCDGRNVEPVSEGARLPPGEHVCVAYAAGYLPKRDVF